MKTILLLISQGETRDLILSQLSYAYALICCDQPQAALEHAREQRAALSIG